MQRTVGSRELHGYENDIPGVAGTVWGTPLITDRAYSLLSQVKVNPLKVTGTVVDIGSGDDSLGIELTASGNSNFELHRVNPALAPDAPIEIQFAMREAIYEMAQRRGVPIEVINSWNLHTAPFPNTPNLPVADWIFSLYAYPTIDIERKIADKRSKLHFRLGLKALEAISHEQTQLVIGPIPHSKLGHAFLRAIDLTKFADKKQDIINAADQFILHIS